MRSLTGKGMAGLWLAYLSAGLMPAFGADTSTEKNPYTYSFRLDCNKLIPELAKPNEVWVRFVDRTEAKDKQRFAKLGLPACKSALGALRASRKYGQPANWIQELPFILVDKLDGKPYQAEFQRTFSSANPRAAISSGDYPRQVKVTSGFAAEFSEPVVTWSLGHEIGHGVLEHVDKKNRIGAEGLAEAIAGGALFLKGKKSLLLNGLGAAVFAHGAYRAICGRANLTLEQEIEADAFGVRTLQEVGYSLQDAKAAPVKLFTKNPTPEETCVGLTGVNMKPHPSSIVRAEAVELLK